MNSIFSRYFSELRLSEFTVYYLVHHVNIRIGYSGGFNIHPVITFPYFLPFGSEERRTFHTSLNPSISLCIKAMLLMLSCSLHLSLPDYFVDILLTKTFLSKIFEGETCIRILPTTLLQIFCENVLYFQFIFKNMKIADDTFVGNSECQWVKRLSRLPVKPPTHLLVRQSVVLSQSEPIYL